MAIESVPNRFVWFTPANPLGVSQCSGESCPLCAPLFAAHRARLQKEQSHQAGVAQKVEQLIAELRSLEDKY